MSDISKFCELPTDLLSVIDVLPFKIFITRNGKPILWRGQETSVEKKDIDQLINSGVKQVYLGVDEKGKYLEFAEENATSILESKKISIEFKSYMINEITCSVLENLFKEPTNHNLARRLENIVKPMVELLLADKSMKSLRFLIEQGDMVFSYIPHSARTCYYTIALAETLKTFTNNRLYQMGVAALLHDIGQTLVPTNIREKIGKYSDNERVEMQRHPSYSVDIIHRSEMYDLDKTILTAVKAHHELGDKSGYPHNLPLFDLPLEAQILAVAHTFESYTIERIHREAKKPYDVVKYMLANPDKYPIKIVRSFIEILGKLEAY